MCLTCKTLSCHRLLPAELDREHACPITDSKTLDLTTSNASVQHMRSNSRNTLPTKTSHTPETFQWGVWKLALGGKVI